MNKIDKIKCEYEDRIGEKRKFEITVPEFYQYEDIPYVRDFCCPECGAKNYLDQSARIIGYCSTSVGYMMVFECMDCGARFRYHNCTKERNNFEKFKGEVWLQEQISKARWSKIIEEREKNI